MPSSAAAPLAKRATEGERGKKKQPVSEEETDEEMERRGGDGKRVTVCCHGN